MITSDFRTTPAGRAQHARWCLYAFLLAVVICAGSAVTVAVGAA